MADILLNKVVNGEIELTLFVKWLLVTDPQEQYFEHFKDCKCSQIDFLTYFLNFIHEEVPCQNKYGDTPQKTTFKRIQVAESGEPSVQRAANIITNDTSNPFTSISLNKDVETANTSINDVSQSSSLNNSHITSTPKATRVQTNCSGTNGYLSPISPLYKGQNYFGTPKVGRKGNTSQRSTEKVPFLCLGDFIVNRKPSVKKKTSRSLLSEENNDETSRRIKPTCLSQVDNNTNFGRTENSFNNFQDTKELSVECLNQSRNFLAEERLKILTRKNSGDNLVPTKKISNFSSAKTEIDPNIARVTNKKQLDVIVDIYINILKNNFVLNVNSEIYFLISLLVSRQLSVKRGKDIVCSNSSDDFNVGVDFLNYDDGSDILSVTKCENGNVNSTDLFDTIHNVVYFAVRCLESQIDVLKYYDRSTLKLLSSNHRLKGFGAIFSEKLSKVAEKKRERIVELCDDNFQANVCFNLDTDNRGNFPSDSSFHSFRKQRDLFYDILRIWENNHTSPGWSFSVGLGGKVRALFSLQGEPANFMHFSRLFKAQLLSTCGKKEKDEGLSESQLPFLTSLPNIDADKLNRLKCRLVTKQSSNGINSLPTFTGYQEFFRDFIVIAGNSAFNKHLCDTLIVEILELNDNNFFCNDLEETGTNTDPVTRKAYVACLKLLRTLAKFLGFIESLPYKSESCNYTEIFLKTQINVRRQTAPSFDVKEVLRKSMKAKNVILIIPWVTEYMAMLDYVTLRLPYYVSVHKILFELYKCCETEPNQHQYNYNVSAVKFCLGWLFELPHFPDSEYFSYCVSQDQGLTVDRHKEEKSVIKSLDDWNIVDQNILYICCPYLENIKKLLSSNIVNSNVTVKHITPVTSVRSSNEIVKKRLEQQLEEAFFNGQSISVRKTVEFVSERVASTCVKHICNVVVPFFKARALEEARKFLGSWKDGNQLLSPARDKSQKNTLKIKVNQIAQTNLKLLREKCETEMENIALERIKSAIDSLLAVDVLPHTRDVCNAITTKLCLERVREWVNSHVTSSVFNKDLDSELQKALSLENKAVKDKPVFMLPPGGSGRKHNEDTLSAFHLLEKLKVSSADIASNSVQISEDLVLNLLDESYGTINERCDVNEWAAMYTCSLLVDFSLLLITHKPEIMNKEEILEKFLIIWRCMGVKSSDLFKNLLCPRNTMLLAQSNDIAMSWRVFANFTAYLIKEELLSCESFENQCTGFFKKDWDQDSLNNFTAFLHTFADCYKRYGGSTDKFTLLIDFLSDYCSDL